MSDQDDVRERLRTLAADEPPAWIHTGDLIYEGRLALRRRRCRQLLAATVATGIVAVGVGWGVALPLFFSPKPKSVTVVPEGPGATRAASSALPTPLPVRPNDGNRVRYFKSIMFEYLDPVRKNLSPDGSAVVMGSSEFELTGRWREGSRQAYTALRTYKLDSRGPSASGGAYFKSGLCGPSPPDLRWTSCDTRRLSDGSELRLGEARAAGRTMAVTATHVRQDGTRVSVTFALAKNSPEAALDRLPFAADDLVAVATDPRISLDR
jgi:hypothetical protein